MASAIGLTRRTVLSGRAQDSRLVIKPVPRGLKGQQAIKVLLSCRLQDPHVEYNAHNADLVRNATCCSNVDGPLSDRHATGQHILSLDGCDKQALFTVPQLRFWVLHAAGAGMLTSKEPVPRRAQLPRFTRTV